MTYAAFRFTNICQQIESYVRKKPLPLNVSICNPCLCTQSQNYNHINCLNITVIMCTLSLLLLKPIIKQTQLFFHERETRNCRRERDGGAPWSPIRHASCADVQKLFCSRSRLPFVARPCSACVAVGRLVDRQNTNFDTNNSCDTIN